jgi:hypothetical protein
MIVDWVSWRRRMKGAWRLRSEGWTSLSTNMFHLYCTRPESWEFWGDFVCILRCV